MSIPQEMFYTKTHEWVSLENGIATIGITDFAQSQLSDLTFVELPDVGTDFSAGDEAAVVESVKAAADVYAPVAGEVVEVNSDLEDSPEDITIAWEALAERPRALRRVTKAVERLGPSLRDRLPQDRSSS